MMTNANHANDATPAQEQRERQEVKRCGCVVMMNEALRESYPGVQLTVALGIHKPTIAVTRLMGKGKTPVIFPTYCPFCGIKYGD